MSTYRPHRAALWEDGYRDCVWCRQPLRFNYPLPVPPDAATIEHKIPKMFGGSNSKANLALACHECNSTLGMFLHSVRGFIAVEGNDLVLKEKRVEMRAMYGAIHRGHQPQIISAHALPRLWWDGHGSQLRRAA